MRATTMRATTMRACLPADFGRKAVCRALTAGCYGTARSLLAAGADYGCRAEESADEILAHVARLREHEATKLIVEHYEAAFKHDQEMYPGAFSDLLADHRKEFEHCRAVACCDEELLACCKKWIGRMGNRWLKGAKRRWRLKHGLGARASRCTG